MTFSDANEERLLHFHESEDFQNYFDSHYSQDILNKIKNFYFHEQNINCANIITRFEHICHVNIFKLLYSLSCS